MLLSEDPAFLFVHIPKTGGTSVARALVPWALQPSTARWNKVASRLGLRRDWRKRHFRVHSNLAHAQARIPDSVFQRMFKFAFVRNPWDRLVSEYSFIVAHPEHRRHRQVAALADFAAYLRYEKDRDRRDQLRMVLNRDGKVGVDFVGHLERLDQDFSHVCQQLGIDANLPHLNRTKHRDYRDLYVPATRDFVAAAWGDEIEAFGYEF